VANADCDGSFVCINGLCHNVCSTESTCPGEFDRCLDGTCVANDIARPECYNNGNCMGGEECFEGICRVPCTDATDCAGCPGNPICATGGYCMDNNDINPECALSSECTLGLLCVDAMCTSSY
jgi:hypothetical protein